jgi:hypothetical protein
MPSVEIDVAELEPIPWELLYLVFKSAARLH